MCNGIARYCESERSQKPKCCSKCKQPGSICTDFYELNNRGGWPFDKIVEETVEEQEPISPQHSESEGEKSEFGQSPR